MVNTIHLFSGFLNLKVEAIYQIFFEEIMDVCILEKWRAVEIEIEIKLKEKYEFIL